MFERCLELNSSQYRDDPLLEFFLENGVHYITTIMKQIELNCLSLQEHVITQFFDLMQNDQNLRYHAAFVVAFSLTEVLVDISLAKQSLPQQQQQQQKQYHHYAQSTVEKVFTPLASKSADVLSLYTYLVPDFSQEISFYENLYLKLSTFRESRRENELPKTTAQCVFQALLGQKIDAEDAMLIEDLLHVMWSYRAFLAQYSASQRAFAILSVLESVNCTNLELTNILLPFQNDAQLSKCAQELQEIVSSQSYSHSNNGGDDAEELATSNLSEDSMNGEGSESDLNLIEEITAADRFAAGAQEKKRMQFHQSAL